MARFEVQWSSPAHRCPISHIAERRTSAKMCHATFGGEHGGQRLALGLASQGSPRHGDVSLGATNDRSAPKAAIHRARGSRRARLARCP